mgnify:CR=1 FL=1
MAEGSAPVIIGALFCGIIEPRIVVRAIVKATANTGLLSRVKCGGFFVDKESKVRYTYAERICQNHRFWLRQERFFMV